MENKLNSYLIKQREMNSFIINKKPYKTLFSITMGILLFLFTISYITSIPIDLMDIDTSQYGEITRESLENNDFLHLKDNGKKYLDKPILTFWTIGIFFKLFGVSNFSFRLPTIIFLFISCYSIYKLTLVKFKNPRVGVLASLIYLAIPGTYTYVLNPTIDLYLNTYLILIHLFYYLGFKTNKNYYYGMYFFLGLGIITKGPIALVIPSISIGGDILLRLDFKRIKEMKIIPGIFILSILPGFWSYILFQDFQDFGPYFFLYLQSFGRFYLKMYDQGWNPLYFSLTSFWMFFTFAPLYIFMTIQYLKKTNYSKKYIFNLIQSNDFKDKDFVIELWFFLFLFFISFSKYRMPQYSFWNIPAASIIFAPFLYKLLLKKNIVSKFYFLIFPSILAIFLIIVIPFLVININFKYIFFVLFFLVAYFIIIIINKNKLLATIFVPIACLFSLVSVFVYPELMMYQPASKLAKKVLEIEPHKKELLTFGVSKSKRSYEFYSNRLLVSILQKNKIIEILEKDSIRLAIIPGEYLYFMENYFGNDIKIEVIEEYPVYKIATPKPSFFLKKMRNKISDRVLLIRIKLG